MLYSPIGYRATWAYLEWRVGRSSRALGFSVEQALDIMEASRAIALERRRDEARVRRLEKAVGNRRPSHPLSHLMHERWHGDEANGALFALRFWQPWGRPPQPSAEADFLAELVHRLTQHPPGSRPVVTPEVHTRLHEVTGNLDREVRRSIAGAGDTYADARELRTLSWHATVALHGDQAALPSGRGR